MLNAKARAALQQSFRHTRPDEHPSERQAKTYSYALNQTILHPALARPHLTASATFKLRARPSTSARTLSSVAGGQPARLKPCGAALPARPTALMAL